MDVSSELTIVAEGIDAPNGLALSPDESFLNIIASRREPRAILAFDVINNGLVTEHLFTDAEAQGMPGGFRVDIHGNLWCGWGMGCEGLDGVHI